MTADDSADGMPGQAREKVLALGPALIVPGHGAPFVPSASTPV
ncbi:hypothetical protein ACIBU0_02055 [Streptomyces sp. NPDC049627]